MLTIGFVWRARKIFLGVLVQVLGRGCTLRHSSQSARSLGLFMGWNMACKSCASESQRHFPAEINIHLGGLTNLSQPGVWVFPRLLVCTDCGFAEFTIPEKETARLSKRDEARVTVFHLPQSSRIKSCFNGTANKRLALENGLESN
jgi:hypothetical protein